MVCFGTLHLPQTYLYTIIVAFCCLVIIITNISNKFDIWFISNNFMTFVYG